jgi:hypothetical protein
MKNGEVMKSFKEFYPFYLEQHQNLICQRLHFLGTTLALFSVMVYLIKGDFRFIILIPFVGYGPAWIGHFFFEKNRPATFKYPIYSLMGDFLMFWEILTGKMKVF